MKLFAPRLIAAAVVSLSLSISSAAVAGPALDTVKAKQSQLFELVAKPASADNDKKIGDLFDEMLDYAALAEASLGGEWAKLTDAQKTEFSDLLKQLVKRSYEKNIRKTVNFSIEYLGEEPGAAGAVLVKTKATHKTDKREPPIEIHYKLMKSGSAYKIRDIITEDVSLVDGYRSQFTKLLKDKGYAALVAKLREKIDKG